MMVKLLSRDFFSQNFMIYRVLVDWSRQANRDRKRLIICGQWAWGRGTWILHATATIALWGFLHLKSESIREAESQKSVKKCQIWLHF